MSTINAVPLPAPRQQRQPVLLAQLGTLKYRPAFPARFASIEAARAHCQEFFRWYNNEHRPGGLGLHTAADIPDEALGMGAVSGVQDAGALGLDGFGLPVVGTPPT